MSSGEGLRNGLSQEVTIEGVTCGKSGSELPGHLAGGTSKSAGKKVCE